MLTNLIYHATLVEHQSQLWISVLCKHHYVIDPVAKRLLPGFPFCRPMIDDYEYETHPERNGRLLRHGNELWPIKHATDVIVEGHAYAQAKPPVREMTVNLSIGPYSKSIAVLGQRYVYQQLGKTVFSEPEPFEKISLDWWNAYGGVDPNYMPRDLDDTPMLLGKPILELFPGAYPRNPCGMGYVVNAQGMFAEMLLPHLEDPEHRLRPESLFCQDPTRWWQQPQAQGFGWVASMWFPRCMHAGYRPYFVPQREQQEQLPEVQDGRLPIDLFDPPYAQLTLNPRLTTEASRGLALPFFNRSLPVRLEGMSPRGPIEFELPYNPPQVTLQSRRTPPHQILPNNQQDPNQPYPAHTYLHTVHIKPDENELSMVWSTRFALHEDELRLAGERPDIDDLAENFIITVDNHRLGRANWPSDRESIDDDSSDSADSDLSLSSQLLNKLKKKSPKKPPSSPPQSLN